MIRPLKENIAIMLYKCGIKPNCSTLIDEETITYGYGKLSDIGIWEYDIPSKYIKEKRNKK